MYVTSALIALCVGQSQSVDRIAILRADAASTKQPIVATVHDYGGVGPYAGPPLAGIQKLPGLTGKFPVRDAFTVFVGPDDNAEIGLLRENTKKGGELELRIFHFPDAGYVKKGPVAGFGTVGLGKLIGDGRVTAICAADQDGQNGDETVIVRSFDDGHQEIEIRSLPNGKKQPLAGPIATDTTFGTLGTNEVIRICRLDLDEPNADQLAVLRSASGIPQLEIVAIPTSLGAEVSTPLASYASVAAADGATILQLAGLDGDKDGTDDVLLVREAPSGVRRVDRIPVPTGLGQIAPTPSVVSIANGLAGAQLFRVAAARMGVDDPPPPPPPPFPTFPGFYTIWFTSTLDPLTCGDTTPCPLVKGAFEGFGPVIGASVTFNTGLKIFNYTGPQANAFKATVQQSDNVINGVVATFTVTTTTPFTFKMASPDAANLPALEKDAVITATLQNGVVKMWPDGKFRITGQATGNIVKADGTTVISTLGYYVLEKL